MIIRRWQAFSGMTATLDGVLFDQVAILRQADPTDGREGAAAPAGGA